MYVCEMDPDQNTVTLGPEEALYVKTLYARDVNLISVPEMRGEVRLKAKVRYGQKEQPAAVTQTAQDQIKIEFLEPQRAVTRGQAVVLYDGDVVGGGGTIDAVQRL